MNKLRFLIITGNPKKTGLSSGLTENIFRGAADGGAEPQILTVEKLDRCHVCAEGWGICRQKHLCAYGKDGFAEAQGKVREAEALCLVSPVYWGELAEGLKGFLDRLRRCEFNTEALRDKPVLLAASPGGSGNGLLSCLEQMDRFCRHTGAVIFDYIGVNRWNHDYKYKAAYAAAKALCQGRRAGETFSEVDLTGPSR
ncbi:MAG: flavodoxin family protein [Spirochaetales bacterium]|jgi:multimeric flavodoxin WrbA|nr:flavodoxin family protein [Spirochaetales bacterium]